MCAQTQQPYYIGRINKIDKRIIKNSILNDTWIYDRKYNQYKAHDTVQENMLWTLYNSDRSSIENRNLLYNGYVWYAAYIAFYEYIKKVDNFIEFNDILSGCLELLLVCIEKYDMTYEHNCGIPTASFYTYYANVVHKELSYILAPLRCEILSKSVFSRFSSVLNFMRYYNETISDINEMTEEEYLSKYGRKFSKNSFIKLYNFMNSSYSLNDDCSFDEDPNSNTDTQVKLKLECAQLNKHNNIDGICDDMFIKEMYNKIISFMLKNENSKTKNKKIRIEMLHKYLMGYTYSEISKILQVGVSRQRIQQIIFKEIEDIRRNLNNIFTDDEIKEIKRFLQ